MPRFECCPCIAHLRGIYTTDDFTRSSTDLQNPSHRPYVSSCLTHSYIYICCLFPSRRLFSTTCKINGLLFVLCVNCTIGRNSPNAFYYKCIYKGTVIHHSYIVMLVPALHLLTYSHTVKTALKTHLCLKTICVGLNIFYS